MSLDTMITELEARADVQSREVRALLEKSERGELSRRQKADLEVQMRGMDVYADRVAELKAQRDRKERISAAMQSAGVGVSETRSGDMAVTHEPMVYGEGAQASYYRDLIHSSLPGHPASLESRDRLTEYGHQVTVEVNMRSDIGRKAENALRSLTQENRTGITTGGGATATAASGGAAFVSPLIFINDYAPYREYGRSFADACNSQDLPDYGMELYLPAVLGPAGVDSQTEGDSVDETDPTFGYLNSTLTTLAGEVTVSQQMLDRAGPDFEFDRMIFDQLNRDYAPKLDKLVLTAALANATSQTYNGSFAITSVSASGGLYGQIAQAKNSLETTEGTVLNANAVFMTPTRWNYIASFADGEGRPLVVPSAAGPFNAVTSGGGNAPFEGATGYEIQGVPISKDANIPNSGTTSNDQILVTDTREIYVWESQQVNRVIPQTLASTLQVIIQTYGYVGCIPRYQAGTVAINGSALAAPTF